MSSDMAHNIETRVLAVNSQQPEAEAIHAAAAVIQAGGLVAFPTETVYGLGADAFNAQAVARIFTAKQRPTSDPLIVHISAVGQLEQLAVDIPPTAYTLADAFWPGPLTLVLKRADAVPGIVAQGRTTIAVRMPAHPVAHALIKAAGTPIAAPSANTFTRPSSTAAQHVLEDLKGRVELVLDGGAATIGLESTVIDLTQNPPVILRPGGITMDDLRRWLPEISAAPQYLDQDSESSAASPGMMIKHYSPRARVMLFDGPLAVVRVAMADTAQRLIANQKRVGILSTDEDAALFTQVGARILSLGPADDLDAIARRLFSAMRALDAQGVDVILVRGFGREGIGAAIWDRLVRAAEGQIITLE